METNLAHSRAADFRYRDQGGDIAEDPVRHCEGMKIISSFARPFVCLHEKIRVVNIKGQPSRTIHNARQDDQSEVSLDKGKHIPQLAVQPRHHVNSFCQYVGVGATSVFDVNQNSAKLG